MKRLFALLLSALFLWTPFSAPAHAQSTFGNFVQAGATVGIGCLTSGIRNRATGFLSSLTKSLTSKEVPVGDQQQRSKEACEDALAYAGAKLAIQTITTATLNWVNNGFSGNPFYLQDPSSYFRSIANEEVNRYLRELPSRNSIFGETIRNDIVSQLTGRYVPPSAGTSFSAQQFESFKKDFRSGGWSAWRQMVDGEYNPILSYLDETGTLGGRIAQKQQNIRDELFQGDGFLSQKKCVEWSKPFVPPTGSSGGAPTGSGSGLISLPSSQDIDRADRDINQQFAQERECLSWKTITPGSAIAEQLKTVITSPTRQLELADEINESLSAIFSALLNQLFSRGLSTLRPRSGITSPAIPGGPGQNVVYDSGGNVIAALDTDDLSRIDEGFFADRAFSVRNPRHLRAVLQTQYNFLHAATDSTLAAGQIVPHLGALDYCIPGPHPTWEEEAGQGVSLAHTAVVSSQADASVLHVPSYSLFNGATGSQQFLNGFSFLFSGLRSLTQQVAAQSTEAWLEGYRAMANTSYSKEALVERYASAAPVADRGYVRGMMGDAIRETQNLTNYASNISELNDEYAVIIRQTEQNISELESIRKEVVEIVAGARARHVEKMRRAGTTVSTACLDQKYSTDLSPIIGQKRKESDTLPEVVNQSRAANAFFYQTL